MPYSPDELDPVIQVEFVETQNARSCKHEFIMKTSKEVQCVHCSWGLIIANMREFQKIKELYGINR